MTMRHFPVYIAAIALLTGSTGCGDGDEVRQYEAVKDEIHAAPPTATAPATVAGQQRLLGAITEHGGKTWFFKLSGPAEAVGAQADNFHRFVHSLTFSDSAQKPVTWSLPEHWHEGEASGPRYATIEVGHGEPALELSVTAFPGEAGGIQANINRWRDQLGLPPIEDGTELRSVAETHDVNGKPVTEIDMTGPGQNAANAAPAPVAAPASPPFAPFAQGSQGAAPANAQSLGEVIEQSPADSPITYKVPEGWREHAAGGFRTAAFSAGPEDDPAVTTIIALGGAAGGVLANVNRWRGQVGLGEIDAEELEKTAEKIEVDGTPAYYVDLAGPEQGVLGVILTRGERTWFVKMVGPKAVVAQEKEKFEALTRSIKFK